MPQNREKDVHIDVEQIRQLRKGQLRATDKEETANPIK